ncbi:HD domain-containing protein [Mucilaginibacter hurinus]|uniref:HD domain-containing protein n=1 Tax=Mucilaginibacter hurinus TaxID=2201324 RepID=UPI002936E71E|nr:HD domain-containing protein [Mucilaginibacter hurinus]
MKEALKDAESGHDWWHIQRVWINARTIAKSEQADQFVVQLAALLHDIADAKFHGGDEEIGPEKAGRWLRSLALEDEVI